MIIVVTNRNIKDKNGSGADIFGNDLNNPPDEIRIATAKRNPDGSWQVDLIPENTDSTEESHPPSQQLFDEVLGNINRRKIGKEWVFFVHGFRNDFENNLKKCHALEKIYGVNVILFSWPSNPGGLLISAGPTAYWRARGNARASVEALSRTLGALSRYLSNVPFNPNCDVNLNFMSYSLGNYLVEQVVRSSKHYTAGPCMFKNIILCQPDVDAEPHNEWVPKLCFGGRVYVTINEDDKVLDCSDVINPNRLGNTARNYSGTQAMYFDFTDGENVGKTHGVFYKFTYPKLKFGKRKNKNLVITEFFQRALTGKRAEKTNGFKYSPQKNMYEL